MRSLQFKNLGTWFLLLIPQGSSQLFSYYKKGKHVDKLILCHNPGDFHLKTNYVFSKIVLTDIKATQRHRPKNKEINTFHPLNKLLRLPAKILMD